MCLIEEIRNRDVEGRRNGAIVRWQWSNSAGFVDPQLSTADEHSTRKVNVRYAKLLAPSLYPAAHMRIDVARSAAAYRNVLPIRV
jgi:hypothetical protein